MLFWGAQGPLCGYTPVFVASCPCNQDIRLVIFSLAFPVERHPLGLEFVDAAAQETTAIADSTFRSIFGHQSDPCFPHETLLRKVGDRFRVRRQII
jgi:hypothetical protein